MSARTIRVAIVDDHPTVVDGLLAGLATIPSIEVVAVASTTATAAEVLSRSDLDVVLLDVRLSDGNGLQVLAERGPKSRPHVLILSSFNARQYVAAATRLGASGFLLKTAPLSQLGEAIHTVAAGGTVYTAAQLGTPLVTLTERERDVVALTMEGLTNKEIADRLATSKKAVEQHLSAIFARHGLNSRVELVLRASAEGWLEIDAPPTRRTRRRKAPIQSSPHNDAT